MNTFIRPSTSENLSGKFWWLSPEGKFYGVGGESHIKWAQDYLTRDMQLSIKPDASPYHMLINMGWMRIGIYEDWLGSGEKESVMEYDCKRDATPPTSLLKKIKILAREKGILWMKRDREKQVSPIDEDYRKDFSSDDHYAQNDEYFQVGQDTPENTANSFCWIWSRADQGLRIKKGFTHGYNFGHEIASNTFKGWYDPSKKMISCVFPENELRKVGNKRPTEDDIPTLVHKKLISQFGKDNKFLVFESKIKEESNYDTDMEVHDDTSYGGWLDPNLKFHAVRHEQHMPWARKVAAKLNLSTEFDQEGYGTLYHLGFVRIVFSGITMYFRNAQWNEKCPITQRQLKALKDIAIERGCKYLNDDSTGKTYTDLNESIDLLTENVVGLKFWWLDPNLKLHPVAFEHHRYWAADYLHKLGQKVNIKTDNVYEIMYRLGFIRVVKQRYGDEVVLSYQYDKQKPITLKQLKQINDLAIEEQCDYVSNDVTGKETAVLKEISIDENMFPQEFDRHQLGSCMVAAELATKYLLSKGMNDFEIIEGWVSLSPDLEDDETGYTSHTWIKFKNGRIFDPTRKQWQNWGYDPAGVKIMKVSKIFTPKEYLDVCEWEPGNWEKFKKIHEANNVDGESVKAASIRRFLNNPNDDLLIVTINKMNELPEASYVQVDYNTNGHNIFSTNPETLQKYGYDIPSSKELLTLPTGKFKLSAIKKRLKTRSLREDMSYDDLLKLTTPERKERASNVNVRSLPVSVNEEKERWNFRYKTSPKNTVTDKPFRGSITFLKGELHQNDDAEKVMCKVDCECPDFMYRFAYNDTAKGASQIGKDSLNKALNRRPKPAYDEGEGLCKHLVALGRFLKTKIDTTKKNNIFEAINEVGKQGPFNVNYYD